MLTTSAISEERFLSEVSSKLDEIAYVFAPKLPGSLQRLECVRAGHEPRRLLQLMQCVKDLLYVSGVIGILAGRTRVTRHANAPDAPVVSYLL
jgi:hypothetical protein